jgi:hypothetical protein
MIGRASRNQKGTTTVELAMIGPLLIFLLFGIIEFGLMVKDVVGINQAAREGARSAAVGATPSTLTTHITSAAPTIIGSDMSVTYHYRPFNEGSGSWGSWQTLGVSGGMNNAQAGDQIRITIEYPHQLVTGGLFAGLADDPESGTVTLNTAIVMQRE